MPNSIYGMKIFSPEQTKRLDMETTQAQGISSFDLMERASDAFLTAFLKKQTQPTKVCIFCGTGNNGGDGLAIARKLDVKGFETSVFVILHPTREPSQDFRTELALLNKKQSVLYIKEEKDIPDLNFSSIVIDAIFGSGLNKPLNALTESVVQMINTSGCSIFSVDIASGLFSNISSKENVSIHPDYTFSFQFPKLAFLLPENEKATGELEVLDIGLNEQSIEKENTSLLFLQKEKIKQLFRKRRKFSHKGNYGHVLVFAGRKGSMGAALLSSKAAMRTGCGLLSVLCSSDQIPIVQTAIWEAMCVEYDMGSPAFSIQDFHKYTLGIGPGIGQTIQAQNLFKLLLSNSIKPLVVDADGINILAKNKELLEILPQNSILTPHPKEFEKLVGTWENDFDRLEKQKNFSVKHSVYIVLKGAHSSISTPEGILYFNSTGNPGMATAGSGDVLTGIIVSLLAQNYTPEQAAILGTFIHGYAGDLALATYGLHSMIATDIIEHLPFAFKELLQA